MAEQCIRTKDMKDKNYSEQLRNNKRLESVIDEVKASKDFNVIKETPTSARSITEDASYCFDLKGMRRGIISRYLNRHYQNYSAEFEEEGCRWKANSDADSSSNQGELFIILFVPFSELAGSLRMILTN